MSNLIDLDVSVESTQLAEPLLPCPGSSAGNDEPRASLGPGDNPFDRAVRQVNRFAALQHDPFEIGNEVPARLSSSFGPSHTNFQSPSRVRSSSLSNLNSIEPNISILIDPPSSPEDENLSILNESQMNDSFGQAIYSDSSFIRGMSNPLLGIQRHASLNSILSTPSSTYSDPFNKAFRIENSFNNSKRSGSFSDLLPQSYKQSPVAALKKNLRDDSIANELVMNTSGDALSNPSTIPIDEPLELVSPPDFDILPPSDDESDLIQLPKSPKLPNQEVDTKPEDGQKKDENIVAEVESDIFSLSDPKNKQFALTRILELKNLVKTDKPEVAKLLDDLENIMGLNYKSNTELLATCLQNSNENKENVENAAVNKKQDLANEKEDDKKDQVVNNNVEPKIENVISFLKHLVQDSSKIDPTMKKMLQDVSKIIHKIPIATESPSKKSGTKVRRSKSFTSPKRSSTPESKTQVGIPTLRNTTPKKSPSVPSRIESMRSDSRYSQNPVPEMPIANTKLPTDIKSKLKRKVIAEPVSKKGPLKAVIPVNNMQKTAILKNSPSPPNPLDVSEKNPIASSTPIIRRTFSQIKPQNLNTKENFLKPASPRGNGLPFCSPIKIRSPRRGIPVFYKAKPKQKAMSPLRTNNQHLKIQNLSTAKRINFTSNSKDDKENQYLM